MTMNDSWGYQKHDDNWKTPKTVVRNLITCARDTGNYLLNIGPKPDGSIPRGIGADPDARWASGWIATGRSIYQHGSMPAAPLQLRQLHAQRQHALHARALLAGRYRGHRRTDEQGAIGAPAGHAASAVKFEQDRFRVRFTGLPEKRAGRSGDHHRHRMRRRAAPGYGFCPTGAPAAESVARQTQKTTNHRRGAETQRKHLISRGAIQGLGMRPRSRSAPESRGNCSLGASAVVHALISPRP